MTTRKRAPLFVLVLAPLLAAPDAAAQEPTTTDEPAHEQAPTAAMDEAREHYRRGLEVYDEGDYRLALVELERAYAIYPTYKMLYNIGLVHRQLGHYAKARLAFEQYLRDGGDAIEAERRADVEKDLRTLRFRTATLTVHTVPSGADVAVNEVELGKAPLEHALVDAGPLRVRVSCDRCATRVRDITLAGGDDQTLTIDVSGAETKPVAPPPPAAPASSRPARATFGWIATGVLAAGAIATGVATALTASSYEDARLAPITGSPEQAQSDLEHRRSTVQALAITTDVLTGLALAAGGVSLYFTLHDRPSAGSRGASGYGGQAVVKVGF